MILRFLAIVVMSIAMLIICFRFMPRLIFISYVNLNLADYQKIEMRVLDARCVEEFGPKSSKRKYMLIDMVDSSGRTHAFASKFYREKFDIDDTSEAKVFASKHPTLMFYVNRDQSANDHPLGRLIRVPIVEAEMLEEDVRGKVLIGAIGILVLFFGLRRAVLQN